MPLTPEEKSRIYEEELERARVRRELGVEQSPAPPTNTNNAAGAGCCILAVVFFIFMIGTCNPTSSPPSPSPSDSYSGSGSGTSSSSVDTFQTLVDDLKAKDEADKAKIIVKDGWSWSSDGDYIRCTGSVKNTGTRTVSYWKVTFEFMNRKGEVIDTDYTNSGETLMPGASKRFETMHSDVPGARKCRAYVEEVSFTD